MKIHRTIVITGASRNRAAFDATLRQLCRAMPRWRLDGKGSKSYTAGVERPSYLVAYEGDDTLPPLVIALTMSGGVKRIRFHSPNIFPQRCGQITREEYNSAAVLFVAALKTVPAFACSGWSSACWRCPASPSPRISPPRPCKRDRCAPAAPGNPAAWENSPSPARA